MKIVTTPMCEDVLKIAGVDAYSVVMPDKIGESDVAVVLSESKASDSHIGLKLNTYEQVLDSVNIIADYFGSTPDERQLAHIKMLDEDNRSKRKTRGNVRVKVFSNFLCECVADMGYVIDDEDYDYVVIPDYMQTDVNYEDAIIVASHSNVSKGIVERIKARYDFLECKLCTKQ